MPTNLTQAGNKLIVAGNKQIETGNKLQAYAIKVRHTGTILKEDQTIYESIEAIEAGVRSVRSLLGPVAAAFHALSNLFDAVTIPTIDFTRTTYDIPVIGRQRFVTGISLGTTRPFRAIASHLENVADDLDAIRTALQAVADGANRIQGQLPVMANNLLTGAEDMTIASRGMTEAGHATVEVGRFLGGS